MTTTTRPGDLLNGETHEDRHAFEVAAARERIRIEQQKRPTLEDEARDLAAIAEVERLRAELAELQEQADPELDELARLREEIDELRKATLPTDTAADSADLGEVLDGREPLTINQLAEKPADFSDAYVRTAINSGVNPSLQAHKLELYANVWREVEVGSIVLPGVTDPAKLARDVRRWVRRRFSQRVSQPVRPNTAGQPEHPNHAAFLGVLYEQAVDLVAQGVPGHAANPQAAEVIEDWVADQLTEHLGGGPMK